MINPATVNRELACLKALFNHVLKADIPLRNLVNRVKFCEEHNEQTRVLSVAEQEKYLAKAPPTPPRRGNTDAGNRDEAGGGLPHPPRERATSSEPSDKPVR
jgi:site-specific recombinase XerD